MNRSLNLLQISNVLKKNSMPITEFLKFSLLWALRLRSLGNEILDVVSINHILQLQDKNGCGNDTFLHK
jgi:hypothetical protein